MDDFEKFLNWLDPDREQAGKKYEEIRRKLIRFFQCRGCGIDAEELTDDTIDRIVKKITELEASYVGDPSLYFFGVSRNVFRESLARQIKIREYEPLPSGDSADEKERLDDCLQRCLGNLSIKDRTLILDYYTRDKHAKIERRRELSKEVGIAPNALRIKAHRIRKELRTCVEKCL